jgi:hypothetical protein
MPLSIDRVNRVALRHQAACIDALSQGDWYPRDQALGGMAEALLRIAGELYLPFAGLTSIASQHLTLGKIFAHRDFGGVAG